MVHGPGRGRRSASKGGIKSMRTYTVPIVLYDVPLLCKSFSTHHADNLLNPKCLCTIVWDFWEIIFGKGIRASCDCQPSVIFERSINSEDCVFINYVSWLTGLWFVVPSFLPDLNLYTHLQICCWLIHVGPYMALNCWCIANSILSWSPHTRRKRIKVCTPLCSQLRGHRFTY